MKEEFRTEFAELLGLASAKSLVNSLNLNDHNWDSLAVVSTIAMLDEHFGMTVDGTSLTRCETFGDLENLIKQKRQGYQNEPTDASH